MVQVCPVLSLTGVQNMRGCCSMYKRMRMLLSGAMWFQQSLITYKFLKSKYSKLHGCGSGALISFRNSVRNECVALHHKCVPDCICHVGDCCFFLTTDESILCKLRTQRVDPPSYSPSQVVPEKIYLKTCAAYCAAAF